jgi:E3 ubiquitin-protein ligase Mdm2
MTLFKNTSLYDIYVQVGYENACLRPGTEFKGRRTDENHIETKEFGVIVSENMLYRVKESLSLLDFQFMLRVKSTKGVIVETLGTLGTDPHPVQKILIPCDQVVEVISRSSMPTPDRWLYCVYYKGEYAWMRVDDDEAALKPLSRPLLLKVVHTDGVLVRRTKECASEVLGYLPYDTFFIVDKKDFCTLYPSLHAQRLRLHGDRGWITNTGVELVGFPTKKVFKKHKDPTLLRFVHGDEHTRCCICQEKDIDATFVHGNHGHSVACMACAKKCTTTQKTCPICRDPVEKIIYNYSR